MSQIDITKQYRTRDGLQAVIYAIYPEQKYAVHGAFCEEGEWSSDTWQLDGKNCDDPSEWDLVEVKPRVKGEVWLNIYPCYCGGQVYMSKEDADTFAQMDRIACIRREYDVEEGEGL